MEIQPEGGPLPLQQRDEHDGGHNEDTDTKRGHRDVPGALSDDAAGTLVQQRLLPVPHVHLVPEGEHDACLVPCLEDGGDAEEEEGREGEAPEWGDVKEDLGDGGGGGGGEEEERMMKLYLLVWLLEAQWLFSWYLELVFWLWS